MANLFWSYKKYYWWLNAIIKCQSALTFFNFPCTLKHWLNWIFLHIKLDWNMCAWYGNFYTHSYTIRNAIFLSIYFFFCLTCKKWFGPWTGWHLCAYRFHGFCFYMLTWLRFKHIEAKKPAICFLLIVEILENHWWNDL